MQSNDSSKFVAIGSDVFLKTGQKPTAQSISNEEPSIILIFGWMGARLPHLHKYSAVYDTLYPEATQLLVRCEASVFWSSKSAKHLALQPVVDVLEALGCVHQVDTTQTDPTDSVNFPPPRILVHCFSNGGALQLTTLGQLLASKSLISPPLTAAYIIDSAPGANGLQGAILAFTANIRSIIQRTVANILITLLYGFMETLYFLRIAKDPLKVLRRALWLTPVDTKSLCMPPFLHKDTPRLYLYSKKDKLVSYDDVKTHASTAERLGMTVKSVVFEKSEHVAHARIEPERYWAAVKDIWEEGVKCAAAAERK